MNKTKLLETIIAADKNHQAHPVKQLLDKAQPINATFTVMVEATNSKFQEWSYVVLKFKNSQVIPYYVPKVQMFAIGIDTKIDLEYTYNTKSVLSKL
jgi:hypothetical protein